MRQMRPSEIERGRNGVQRQQERSHTSCSEKKSRHSHLMGLWAREPRGARSTCRCHSWGLAVKRLQRAASGYSITRARHERQRDAGRVPPRAPPRANDRLRMISEGCCGAASAPRPRAAGGRPGTASGRMDAAGPTHSAHSGKRRQASMPRVPALFTTTQSISFCCPLRIIAELAGVIRLSGELRELS